MTEYELDALIAFVRREADFAEQRANGQPVSPRVERESEDDFREAMRDQR